MITSCFLLFWLKRTFYGSFEGCCLLVEIKSIRTFLLFPNSESFFSFTKQIILSSRLYRRHTSRGVSLLPTTRCNPSKYKVKVRHLIPLYNNCIIFIPKILFTESPSHLTYSLPDLTPWPLSLHLLSVLVCWRVSTLTPFDCCNTSPAFYLSQRLNKTTVSFTAMTVVSISDHSLLTQTPHY